LVALASLVRGLLGYIGMMPRSVNESSPRSRAERVDRRTSALGARRTERKRGALRASVVSATLLAAGVVLTAAAVPDRGEVALALMLRKLATVGTVMHVTAHPDDEPNGLLAMQSRGQGLRVVLATATRGNGGQNEIGPEIFEALGVLRTEELLAAHRSDGAEQFFTRAVDFGYSFSIEESFEKWGKAEILGDYVRLIRMTRPDLMFTMRPDGSGGGQHHQASARLGVEAFRAAGDPSQYPEQMAHGLRPWQPRKIYRVGRYGFGGEPPPDPGMTLVPVDVDVYDPLLGKTYAEIGSEARSMHKCQGFGQLLALPGPAIIRYILSDSTIAGEMAKEETGPLDGLDLTFAALPAFAGAQPPRALTSRVEEISRSIKAADERLRADGPGAAGPPLATGLLKARALRDALPTLGLSDEAVYEIRFRLTQTIEKFDAALVAAHGLRFEALADDGVVTPGQAVKLTLIAANRGRDAIAIDSIALDGFDGAATTCQTGSVPGDALVRCEVPVTIPANARTTEPYWTREGESGRYVFAEDAPFGLPFRPTPFHARFELTLSGATVPVVVDVAYRYEGNIFSGEKRMDVLVVPALTVRMTPDIAIVPTAGVAPQRTSATDGEGDRRVRVLRVTATHNSPVRTEAVVSLDLPRGWNATPADARITFERPDEARTIEFRVQPPAPLEPGSYPVAAKIVAEGQTFTRGFETIEYPHIRRQHIFSTATAGIKALDVRLPAGLQVGYIMGVGDQVPPAIDQLGATVTLLDAGDLESGNLSRYDAIVTGVRAYERRRDLRANNYRLLEYVAEGGVVIVQYNKFEFNQAQYGPYPAKVSANRVTDESSPVTVLAPDHPVFTRPNRITPRTWEHWVQERGLYFLGERDPRYVDLLELADPFPLNAGPKRGALVEAAVGKGRWLYVGLNLWRQLPAGTEGAYELLANVLALGAHGKTTSSSR
jgi:LmbE family N-acetylglucosaminyl deacetylase